MELLAPNLPAPMKAPKHVVPSLQKYYKLNLKSATKNFSSPSEFEDEWDGMIPPRLPKRPTKKQADHMKICSK